MYIVCNKYLCIHIRCGLTSNPDRVNMTCCCFLPSGLLHITLRGIVNQESELDGGSAPPQVVLKPRWWWIMDSLSKANKGYNYISNVIDILSKFAWVEPINTNSDKNLQLEKLHTDKGTGFKTDSSRGSRKIKTFCFLQHTWTQKRLLLNDLIGHSKERCGNILQPRRHQSISTFFRN